MKEKKNWKHPRRWWSVAFVIDDADSGPLSRVEAFETMHVDGVRRISVGPSGIGESEEIASLKLELLAENADDAESRAINLVLQGRRVAGLADAIPTIVWVAPLVDDDNASSVRFLERAEDLLEDEDTLDMAVIAAQIHLEVQVRVLLAQAVRKDGPEWAELLTNSRGLGNLNSKLTQQLVSRLLGLEVNQMPEWPAYKKHIVTRNSIVHEGQAVELEQARASVKTAREIGIRLTDAARDAL
jgi:hypothetical protein